MNRAKKPSGSKLGSICNSEEKDHYTLNTRKSENSLFNFRGPASLMFHISMNWKYKKQKTRLTKSELEVINLFMIIYTLSQIANRPLTSSDSILQS